MGWQRRRETRSGHLHLGATKKTPAAEYAHQHENYPVETQRDSLCTVETGHPSRIFSFERVQSA